MKKPDVYVHNIDDSIRFIEDWTTGDFEAFLADVKTNKAVVRLLHELTESMQRLEKLCGSEYPDVPWKEVISFRNVVVHDYLGLDLKEVWRIVTVSLPQLKPHIQRMLADLSNRPHS